MRDGRSFQFKRSQGDDHGGGGGGRSDFRSIASLPMGVANRGGAKASTRTSVSKDWSGGARGGSVSKDWSGRTAERRGSALHHDIGGEMLGGGGGHHMRIAQRALCQRVVLTSEREVQRVSAPAPAPTVVAKVKVVTVPEDSGPRHSTVAPLPRSRMSQLTGHGGGRQTHRASLSVVPRLVVPGMPGTGTRKWSAGTEKGEKKKNRPSSCATLDPRTGAPGMINRSSSVVTSKSAKTTKSSSGRPRNKESSMMVPRGGRKPSMTLGVG